MKRDSKPTNPEKCIMVKLFDWMNKTLSDNTQITLKKITKVSTV